MIDICFSRQVLKDLLQDPGSERARYSMVCVCACVYVCGWNMYVFMYVCVCM